MLNSIILPLALIVQPTPNWHHARESAHASLLHVVSEQLRTSRDVAADDLFIEAAVGALPLECGFPSQWRRLTPDIVAIDRKSCEILVIEATICPDAALPRYVGRKKNKYKALCQQATPTSPLRVLPPFVVAVGTSGLIAESTKADLALALNADEALPSVLSAVSEIAAVRPERLSRERLGAGLTRERLTRRQRRRRHLTMGLFDDIGKAAKEAEAAFNKFKDGMRVARVSHVMLRTDPESLNFRTRGECYELLTGWKERITDESSGSEEKMEELFKILAEERSECVSQKDGGDLGYLTPAAKGFAQEFCSIAFADGAEEGKIYGPIETEAGLHLLYLHEVRQAM